MKKIIIVYDITDDKIRNYVSNQLKNYGLHRIGYSVFNGEIPEEKLKELEKTMAEYIKDDKMHIIELCEKCYAKIKLLGKAEIAEESEIEVF
ncbi:MAG: CRISPR-associated endonuclease Cas2 [Candidatus Diapherotrites archaeon]